MDRKEARRIAEAVYPALPLLVFWMFLILAGESFPTLRSIVLLAAVLIPSLGGSWFLFRSKSRSAGMSEKETGEVKKASPGERQQKETEILALQNQINPHFLYNVLDSIRGQAIVEGVSEIAEMTEALSKLFRYSISNSDAVVYLGNEIKNLRTYFTIQQYRFNNRFELIIENDADDEAIMQYRIPKMTIQPIVENAIYHGLEMNWAGLHYYQNRPDREGSDPPCH